jgi:serine/threonine protein phosphatase PrpC
MISFNTIFCGKTHKENESINNCQDNFHIAENCLAIADGASQSFYSGIWAEMLVQHFCQNPDVNESNWKDWLHPIQEKWLSEIKQRIETAKKEENPSWVTNINRLNAREPATSTFVGLQFLENQIKVSIVGDSCLFIFHNNQLTKSYLLKKSDDFNDRPQYFASYAKDNIFKPCFFDVPLDSEQEKVHFILATDALAEWILKNVEQIKSIIPNLLNIKWVRLF